MFFLKGESENCNTTSPKVLCSSQKVSTDEDARTEKVDFFLVEFLMQGSTLSSTSSVTFSKPSATTTVDLGLSNYQIVV